MSARTPTKNHDGLRKTEFSNEKPTSSRMDENSARKKKKTVDNRDIRADRFAYNEYVERKSILDQVYSDSSISRSPFRGLLRFILIIGFIWVINHTLVSHSEPLTPAVPPSDQGPTGDDTVLFQRDMAASSLWRLLLALLHSLDPLVSAL